MDHSQKQPEASSLRALVAPCVILALAIFPLAVIVAAVNGGGLSGRSLLVALFGGGVCFVAAALGLLSTYLGTQLGAPVQGVLLGMLARMGLPLVALVGLPKVNAELASGGLMPTILCVYAVALVVETVLAVRMVPKSGVAGALASR